MRSLSKTFAGVRALDDVDLEVNPGEIVALVGQNGSGKSTLVKVLAGLHQPDAGSRIELGDSTIHFLHQDLGLIPRLSTIENLGLDRRRGLSLLRPARRQHERRRARELIGQMGASIDVDAPVSSLTASERAIVAIARALDGWTSPRQVLVLDEPTAALHGEEVGRLFDAVRRVAARGAGVVFISHHLDEVLQLADRVVALRGGRAVADSPVTAVDHAALVRMIVGRDLEDAASVHREVAGEALRVTGLYGEVVDGLDLHVRAGEIVGITGVIGSGREEVAGLVFGSSPAYAGEVRVDGTVATMGDPRASIAAGMAFVPADRMGKGAVMSLSARENLTLVDLSAVSGRIVGVRQQAELAEAERWAAEVDLRPPDTNRPLGLFSGGNQQKVVLAKWLRTHPRVLLLDEPSQGVDVGAKAAIYELMAKAATEGAAILVSSSDSKELAELCDRVLVIRDGRLAAELTGTDLTEERLMLEALGAPDSANLYGTSKEPRA
ncbi:sugar ABC transporter ATP-binding protein [Pseudonocardia sp. CA-107938]|uniref:sugar ABC transporter ATP-binding protein n=1 Tax=Pseudonocardia sp. CA-107938 TaxID=3240021 RepID=UPI003D92A9B3